MVTSTNIISSGQSLPVATSSGPPEIFGDSLRIFDRIEEGFGVVPILGEYAGSHLLQAGEVAVYDTRWRDAFHRVDFELSPGLYCYEHQRPPASMHPTTVGHSFLRGDRVHFEISRKVVVVTRHPRNAEHWAYRELRSKLHHGVRLPSRLEGPLYEYALLEHLLGPIVGIYRPHLEGGLN